jgi:hypothetical protein
MERSKYEAKMHTSYDNSLHEIRFKVLLFLYRMGGIPLKVNSASRLNAVYNAGFFACFYITYFCVSVYTFSQGHQLTLAMKKFRIVLMFQIGMWLHLSIR